MKLTDPGYLIDFFEGYFCHNNVIESPSDMSSLEPLTFQIKHFREGHPAVPLVTWTKCGRNDQMGNSGKCPTRQKRSCNEFFSLSDTNNLCLSLINNHTQN